MLFLTSLTGMAALDPSRDAHDGALLALHLACVLRCSCTMPYGKFVHGIYRFLALLVRYAKGAGDEWGMS